MILHVRSPLASAVCLALAAAVFIPISAKAQEPAKKMTPRKGGILVMSFPNDPPTINPVISTSPPDQTLGCMIYQGLVEIGMDYRPVPVLAKSWTISPDGKTYSFDLIHTKWQDGKPFTSEDVKFSLLEVNAKYSTVFRPTGKHIESIDTPAPDKVVIHLKQSFGPTMINLSCDRGGAIMPKHIYQGTNPRENPATSETPVGLGPFKLVERKHGDYIRLDRNPTYWEKGRPYLDEVVAKVMTQSTARVQALQADEVDLVPSIPLSSRAAIVADPKLRLLTSDTNSMNLLFFNLKHKPLDNKAVRKALYMAIDRNYLLKHAFFDEGEVSKNPLTKDIPWVANPKVDLDKMYAFDPKKANAMLDAAGVKRGADGKRFPLRIVAFASSYPELAQVAVALKSMWGDVGVEVTVELVESATIVKKVFGDRDFDVHLNGYGTYSDPALGIARIYRTTPGMVSYGNPSGYSNPEVDKLLEQGESGTTIEQRAPFYQKVQEIVAEDVPVISLREYRVLNAMSKKVWSVYRHAQGTGRFNTAWMEK